MSQDPFASFQAPPSPPPPPAGPFPPYGDETPVYGVRRHPGREERYPASGETFPAFGEPFPAAGRQEQPSAASVRRSRELADLRAAYRRQRRVAGVTVLGFFALYILLTVYVPAAVNWRVAGGVNLGMLLGLLQLPLTVVALLVYQRTARAAVDPLVERVRGQAEEER
ncbi:DUF485 domain-containing protein [Streptomyces sp. NPDC002734]|uniref:DUF485 domain-containing protein n=1 Tax=Streptomyces sp. NPDC002734 TaxID=3154426 RepID=UPI00332B5B0D